MIVFFRRGVSAALVLCLLLLSGPVYAQTVRHAAHHAHHNAATHATAICSLMCAAGQVLEASWLDLPISSGPVWTLLVPPIAELVGIIAPPSSSRGPPAC